LMCKAVKLGCQNEMTLGSLEMEKRLLLF